MNIDRLLKSDACPTGEDDPTAWISSCLEVSRALRNGTFQSTASTSTGQTLAPVGRSQREETWYVHLKDLKRDRDVRVRQMNLNSSDERPVEHFFVRTQSLLDLDVAHFPETFALVHHPPYVSVLGTYVKGESLDSWLERHDAPGRHRILRGAAGIVDALQAAARRNLHHLNLKPTNVIVTPDGRLRFTDACIRRLYSQMPELWEHEKKTWSDWLPPEMIPDSRAGDARSDQYLLGRLIVYLLTGGHTANPDQLPGDGTDLRTVLGRCLAGSPGQRFPGYTFLRRRLAALGPTSDLDGDRPGDVPLFDET